MDSVVETTPDRSSNALPQETPPHAASGSLLHSTDFHRKRTAASGPSARELLQQGPQAMEAFLQENPAEKRRIQAELKELPLLSGGRRRSVHNAIGY